MIMGCMIQDILLYLKDTLMVIGYLMLKTQNLRVRGYVFTLGGATVSWKSLKQTVIAKSIMKCKFIALDKCGEEAEWLRYFLKDIPRWPKLVPPICIHCDSQSAVDKA